MRKSSKQWIGIGGTVIALVALGLWVWTSQNGSNPFTGQPSPKAGYHSSDNRPVYSGSESCQSCHEQEYSLWENSHHDLAMKKATPETVVGNFDDVTRTFKGDTWRFFTRQDTFFIETTAPGGQRKAYPVKYTFGIEPLQQYLVPFPGGRLQSITIAWDSRKGKWFDLYPDTEVNTREWIHWSSGGQNWNTMCASCHSTYLEKNYDPVKETFNTHWELINVSCESCHGPGKEHVQEYEDSTQYGEAHNYSSMLMNANVSEKTLVEECGRCHMRREQLTNVYQPGDDIMDHFVPELVRPPNYFADGKILEEDYVYGSFKQSKMYHAGITCTDCHNAHSLDLIATGNDLCNSCHQASDYETPDHHFHEPNTEASQCVSCHMTGRTYMGNDFRRDHSFKNPNPELSINTDVPNACNNCHDDQSAKWAAGFMEEWYGDTTSKGKLTAYGDFKAELDQVEEYEEYQDHDSFEKVFVNASQGKQSAIPKLADIAGSQYYSDMIRATALWHYGQIAPSDQHQVLLEALDDSEPLVRYHGVEQLAQRMEPQRRISHLAPLLEDTTKAVRLIAFENLSGISKQSIPKQFQASYDSMKKAYKKYLDINADFPGGQLRKAYFHENRNQTRLAKEAYRQALDLDTLFNAARIGLGHLLNRQGRTSEARQTFKTVTELEPEYGSAWYSLGLLWAQEGRYEQAAEVLGKATELMPENARAFYNYGLALQNLNQREQAGKQFERALELQPNHPDYHYALAILYLQQNLREEARPHIQWFIQNRPNDRRTQNLRRYL